MNKLLKEILAAIYKDKNVVYKEDILLQIRKVKEKTENSEQNEIIKYVLDYFSIDKPWIQKSNYLNQKHLNIMI